MSVHFNCFKLIIKISNIAIFKVFNLSILRKTNITFDIFIFKQDVLGLQPEIAELSLQRTVLAK